MGIKGEVHFVKVAGRRLLQGPVMVRSRLWDGEIEIATIPDYCAYLRTMSWVDIFDVADTAAVRARYDEERARGVYGIPGLRGASEKVDQDPVGGMYPYGITPRFRGGAAPSTIKTSW